MTLASVNISYDINSSWRYSNIRIASYLSTVHFSSIQANIYMADHYSGHQG